jgi:hypothetical protein
MLHVPTHPHLCRSEDCAQNDQLEHGISVLLTRKPALSGTESYTFFAIGCALAFVGVRCLLISIYGSPTPYWDQWDAEGADLYARYFDGTLRFSDLFQQHNEHRILITRIWSLILLELNGYWDPILQMIANSLLFGLAVALLLVWLRPLFDTISLTVFAGFCMVIFGLPLAWENILAGFHSAWYFLILFSLTGLFVLHNATAFSSRWWTALLLLCLSYLSMAGGALTMSAAAALCLAQIIAGRRSSMKEWIALIIISALSALLIIDIPALSYHQALSAQSLIDFVRATAILANWPLENFAPVPCAIAIHAPAILLSIIVIRQRLPLADRRWFLVATTAWVLLSIAATAYGRGHAITASRYLDIIVIALALNCACLLHLLRIARDIPRGHKLAVAAAALWLLVVLHGTVWRFMRNTVPDLATMQLAYQAQMENLRGYLATGDMNFLTNKRQLYIPYPDANRLATLVSMPSIRAILPPELVGEAHAVATRNHGIAHFTGGAIGAFKRLMLRDGFLLIPIGLWLMLNCMLLRTFRSQVITTPNSAN